MIPQPAPPPATVPAPARQQIGVARMETDGTIILTLRLITGRNLGNAEIRYNPGTPDHARVRTHLQSLTPEHPVPVYDDWP